MTEHTSGCVVCGAALQYASAARVMACAYCGGEDSTNAWCQAEHYVCDTCHSGDAKAVIERACAASTSTDPMAVARALMAHPKVKLHGPEHHFLVPAALLAAWFNLTDPAKKAACLAEARRRSDTVVGGMCGLHGTCGAAVGAGIFLSIVTGTTPLSTDTWRLSNLCTAECLGVIARAGGPRCCKRDTWLAILTAARFARQQLGVALHAGGGDPCAYSTRNAQCLQGACPFHRGGPVSG